jgi:hypothetical protein
MKPVLYVSHSKRGLFYYNDASARYRCVFPAEELIANDEPAHAIHFSQISKIKLDDYKKIIFHRPQYSFKLLLIVKFAQRKGIELWVDFDDLLFCPELSDTSAAVQSGKMSPALAKKHAKRYLKALMLFSNYQVSTDELAHQLKLHINSKFNREFQQSCNIKVSYNKIPERWVKQAEIIPAKERLEKKIIRYLPGTSHHKHDFAHIEKFLVELLYENPDYHLNIIGDLDFNSTQFPSAQISQTPFQPFEQLPSLMNDSWIIIAPLVDNVFNRCKSGLKFWESGVFGIPVISSPLKDIERFNNEGLCLSDDIDAWKNFITRMEILENYATASVQAKETSQQAFFTQSTNNHRHLYLKLTSEFGPRWPGDLINPTSTTNKKLLETYKAITQSDLNNTDDALGQNKKMLLSLANKSIENDLPPIKYTAIRKLKKLTASPKSFFKDSKYFKLLSSKG